MQDKYFKLYRKCVFIANQIDSLVNKDSSEIKIGSGQGSIFDDEVIDEINRIKPVVNEFEVLRSKKFELLDKM